MKPLFVIIFLFILFLLVVILIEKIRSKRSQKGTESDDSSLESTKIPINTSDSECCGQHAVCERDEKIHAATRPIEYYDDEELDAFAGISSGDYSEEQVLIFEEILHTMDAKDVAGWLRSLQLRGVELPDELKDEVMIITDKS